MIKTIAESKSFAKKSFVQMMRVDLHKLVGKSPREYLGLVSGDIRLIPDLPCRSGDAGCPAL